MGGKSSGKASEEVLNDKVRRVLRLIFRTEMNRFRPWGSLCSDEHYQAAQTDPLGLTGYETSYCVLRGGGWSNIATYCRVAVRNSNSMAYRNRNIGMRLALTAE